MTFYPNFKVIYQRGKTSIFHPKSEGILHSLFAVADTSTESAGNTLRFKGKFQYIFQTKFFPLGFEGISYNSVVSD